MVTISMMPGCNWRGVCGQVAQASYHLRKVLIMFLLSLTGLVLLCDQECERNRACYECRKPEPSCWVSIYSKLSGVTVILAVFYLKMQLIYITLMFVSKIIILRIFIVSWTYLEFSHCDYRATDMNEHSSRSHAIFIITIECSTVRQLNIKSSS